MLRLCQITVGCCDAYGVKSKHCKLACYCFYIWKNIDLSRCSAKKTACGIFRTQVTERLSEVSDLENTSRAQDV